MRETFVVLALLGGMGACAYSCKDINKDYEAREAKKTPKERHGVRLLFEQDGCKVYRFDDGDVRHFVTCRGAVMDIKRVRIGKVTHIKEVIVPTGQP